MPTPADLVAPVIGPATACMPLGCPEGSPYEPMGICTLILKIALGSVAPFMPMLEVVLGLPGSILDIPGLPALAVDLPGLPWVPLADIPPIPILDFEVGGLELPAWDGLALGNLIFAILTIPLDIAIGLLSFDIPDLSFDGMLELVLGAIAAGLNLPALMLPTLGLLDLAICIIALILLPIMLILAALGPFLDLIGSPVSEGGAGIELPPIPTKEEIEKDHNLTDEEKKAKGEKIINKMVAAEAAADRAKRQAEMNASANAGLKEKKNKSWRPGIGDDFYG
tara:strand:- start:674 stop:1516 length:843 start_codon:yes stop_codon:yes gene_type:complete